MSNTSLQQSKQDIQTGKQSDNAATTRSDLTFVPKVDILETKDALILYADLPGVNKKNVKVSVDKGILTLDAQVDLQRYEGLKPIYAEYRIGNYFRSFQLGEKVDNQKISAEMKDGVLTLTLPKAEEAKERIIQIQ